MRLGEFVDFNCRWRDEHPEGAKAALAAALSEQFALEKDGALLVGAAAAVRVNQIRTGSSYSNTVVAFRKLQQYDDRPILACLLHPAGVDLRLANTTFVAKVSHSSHGFSLQHPVGSILGSDIGLWHDGVPNEPARFEELWEHHRATDAGANLARVAAATQAIGASARPWVPDAAERRNILAAASLNSRVGTMPEYAQAARDLDARVQSCRSEILVAADDENRKTRGDAIEQIVSGLARSHDLADLTIEVAAVAIDKFLRLLARGDRLLAMFFVGVDPARGIVHTRLCSVLDRTLLRAGRVEARWSARGGRGTVQFRGSIAPIWDADFAEVIDVAEATAFLERLLAKAPSPPPC